MKMAVIGGGTMGNGIAHVFAQNGHDVTLIDVKAEFAERALKTIEGNLMRQVKKEAISEADANTAAMNSEAVQRALNGGSPKKVIFIAARNGQEPKINVVV